MAGNVLAELDKFNASRRRTERDLVAEFASSMSRDGYDLTSRTGRWDQARGTWAADSDTGVGPSADQLQTQAIVEKRKRLFEELVEQFGEAAPLEVPPRSWFADPDTGAVDLLNANDARRQGFTIGPSKTKREAQRGFVESRRLPGGPRAEEPPALQDLAPVREHVLLMFQELPRTGLPVTGIKSDLQIRRGVTAPLYQVNQVLRELEREGVVFESVPGVYDLGRGPQARGSAPTLDERIASGDVGASLDEIKELVLRYLRGTSENLAPLNGIQVGIRRTMNRSILRVRIETALRELANEGKVEEFVPGVWKLRGV